MSFSLLFDDDDDDGSVLTLLRSWGVEELKTTFEENEIDNAALSLLDEETIKELIPKIGTRMKFLQGWRKKFLKAKESSKVEGLLQLLPMEQCETYPSIADTDSVDSVNLDESIEPESCSSDSSFQPPPLKRSKGVYFDVGNILAQNAPGRKAMENIKKQKFCSKSDRRIVVDLCTNYMMQQHGNKPSSFVKGALAGGIIRCFPCLADPAAPFGYEAWYCQGASGRPATGYLEEHLRYLRKKAISLSDEEPSPKIYKKNAKCTKERHFPDPEIPKDEVTMMVEWLKSNKAPREKVTEFMSKTAFHRRKIIQESNGNVNSILQEFPRLLDEGMIEQDFGALFHEKENKLYEKWDKFADVIIAYGEQYKWREYLEMEHVEVAKLTDDQKKNLAFFMLPIILRGVKGKRGHSSAQQSIKSFITVQPEVVDIEEYARKIDGDLMPQPFVVCRGTHLTPSQAYVILERHALPQPSLLKAIDVCFKSVYILDIEFQQHCKLTWQFLQNVIYEFLDTNVASSVRDLRAFISSN